MVITWPHRCCGSAHFLPRGLLLLLPQAPCNVSSACKAYAAVASTVIITNNIKIRYCISAVGVAFIDAVALRCHQPLI